jgi:VanZ family protein
MLKFIIFIRPFAKYLLMLWAISIMVVSSTPHIVVPKIHTAHAVIRLDYLIHFLEYGLLTGLSFLTFTGEKFATEIPQAVKIGLILLIFATIDEFHQKLIPGRSFNPMDLYSNISGILSGIIISIALFRLIARKKRTAVRSIGL